MSLKFFLIAVFVVFALPCMELPEWAGAYDDASNDFTLVPSITELAGSKSTHCDQRLPTQAGQRTSVQAVTLLPIGIPNFCEGVFLPDLQTVRRE